MSVEKPINPEEITFSEDKQQPGIAVDAVRSMSRTELSREELGQRIASTKERLDSLQKQKIELDAEVKRLRNDPNYGIDHPVTKAAQAALKNHIEYDEARVNSELKDWEEKLVWRNIPPPPQ